MDNSTSISIFVTPGTPVSKPCAREGLEEEQIKMNFSAEDETVLVPKDRSGAESTSTPIKFTERPQNGVALRVRPQGQSLLRTLVFDAQDEKNTGPRFLYARWAREKVK